MFVSKYASYKIVIQFACKIVQSNIECYVTDCTCYNDITWYFYIKIY